VILRPDRRTSWFFTLSLSVVVMMTSLAAENVIKRPHLHKGTWIWETPTIIAHRDEILAFSEQHGVTHIYLYIDRNRVTPNDYSLFIKEAAKHQIKVEALGGDPSWGWKEKRGNIQDFIEWVASYNTNVNEDERFSGIHLDIEPYLLPEWKTDPSRIIEEWLSNMEFAANQAGWLGELKMSVDLPFWVHKIEVPGYEEYDVSTWMLKRFDTVVLMDYRDTAEGRDGIVSNALAMVNEASSMNKSLIVGVEIAPSNEADKTTFYEEGYEIMEQELEMTRQYLEKYSGFQGVAVHGFPDWMSAYQKGD
jgi:hypothetical protein